MIDDLSESLRALLTQPGLPPKLAGAQIVFDRPAETFNPTQTTLNLFLYDLRDSAHAQESRPGAVAAAQLAPGRRDRKSVV